MVTRNEALDDAARIYLDEIFRMEIERVLAEVMTARDGDTVWLSRAEARLIAPGLSVERLESLERQQAGPPTWMLSDGTHLYDELLFRRWLESTVDSRWVDGVPGSRRPAPSRDRSYVYADARLDELRRRTYISRAQLLALLPGMLKSQADELRASGTGPRFLRPTPHTIVYVAEEALWWAETVPSFTARHERGYARDGEHRMLLTPPVAIRRPLTPVEEARIRDAVPDR